jgi:hypothetical protein
LGRGGESERKMPKKRTKIKMGTTGSGGCHMKERGKKLRRRWNCGKRHMERIGCQTTHINWECRRKKKKKILIPE